MKIQDILILYLVHHEIDAKYHFNFIELLLRNFLIIINCVNIIEAGRLILQNFYLKKHKKRCLKQCLRLEKRLLICLKSYTTKNYIMAIKLASNNHHKEQRLGFAL